MVVVLRKSWKKEQLDAALERMSKTRRRGARIMRFVGKVRFEGDPLTVQKQMRRDSR